MKLSDYVIRWGKDRPDHAFLSLDGKTITYGEADAFTKGKGNVGTPGCVSYMFDEKGQIIVAKED